MHVGRWGRGKLEFVLFSSYGQSHFRAMPNPRGAISSVSPVLCSTDTTGWGPHAKSVWAPFPLCLVALVEHSTGDTEDMAPIQGALLVGKVQY